MVRRDIQLRSLESARRALRHPLFAWLGLRPVWGQHTPAERQALREWAKARSALVEIGVAEGASAAEIREVMAPTGTLWLVDPFHLSRVPGINATKRAAHRVVENRTNGSAIWIEKFSFDAVRNWNRKIDFLFLDGDHSEEGIQRDWEDWNRFVVPGGIVAFHDAVLFPGGWTQSDWGPVKLVDRLFRNSGLPQWKIVQEVHSLFVVQRVSDSEP
jgi:predicted O-methyltransferase YrrM